MRLSGKKYQEWSNKETLVFAIVAIFLILVALYLDDVTKLSYYSTGPLKALVGLTRTLAGIAVVGMFLYAWFISYMLKSQKETAEKTKKERRKKVKEFKEEQERLADENASRILETLKRVGEERGMENPAGFARAGVRKLKVGEMTEESEATLVKVAISRMEKDGTIDAFS